ncbi:hypothetical protein KRX57_00760 [Weeksellaceae bacterium TAE3-ERU29]|nr:hypothetical protein [Weeksellaceae bacterium TAE3-ERU29]
MSLKKIFPLLLIYTLISVNAQDLTGKWVIVPDKKKDFYAELNLIHNEGNLYGGHSYDTENGGFCRHWVDATFDTKTKSFDGKDVELIDKSPTHDATNYILKYSKEKDGKEYLTGTQQLFNLQQQNRSGNDFFDLFFKTNKPFNVKYVKVSNNYTPYNYKVDNSIIESSNSGTTIIEENETPQKSTPFKSIVTDADEVRQNQDTIIKEEKSEIEFIKENRKNKLVSSIQLNDLKEVTLLIKDYGEIDNDTVSIFFNKKLIADKIRIDKDAEEYKLKLEKGVNELIFVANNLGDVPPNTAKITIIADNRRYNYRIFTDEENNALIRLIR